jgi:hypothetical protein
VTARSLFFWVGVTGCSTFAIHGQNPLASTSGLLQSRRAALWIQEPIKGSLGRLDRQHLWR